ncbi:MAG: metallophosphoesterase [Nitrospiraceae bacterium]|nr:metallophosphoesterase [Nitrospiraceae bacterium]
MFVLIASLIQIIIVLAHLLVYKAAFRFVALPARGLFPVVFRAFFFVLPFSFLAASSLAYGHNSLFTRVFYTAAAMWLGYLIYFFFAALFLYLLLGLAKLSILPFRPAAPLWGIVLFSVAFVAGSLGIANARAIRVTRLSVQLPGMPAQWIGRKAVWVSDLHLGQLLGQGFSTGIADRINRLVPDIVFLGGDIWDGLAAPSRELIDPLARIKAPLGIYIITGNHEEFSRAATAAYMKIAQESGIHNLDGKKIELDGVQLLGLGYMESSGQKKFGAALARLGPDRGMPSILLKHSPADFAVSEDAGITLQLSGHTHHGQVFPVNLITPLVYNGYDSGFKKERGTVFYTSSGAGTWGPPLRLGTRPEIVLIQFR